VCFSRPQIVRRRDLPVEMARVARLMNLVFDSRISDAELVGAVESEPALSGRLLAAVNAQAMGGLRVDSVARAIDLVGRAPLHRWLTLVLTGLVQSNTGVERDAVVAALARGRLCELLATDAGAERATRPMFLTGLLSTFDGMLGMTSHDLLNYIHVPADVEAALRHRDGPHAPYLRLASLYEEGNWDDALILASQLGVDAELPLRYSQARQWARRVIVSR
ncbi:MAG: HDOD domain-containing protein, partial [Gemmatimonadota bacterium]|nr:HDOD domain-containing protein [Gemmatimonadota bacterium]